MFYRLVFLILFFSCLCGKEQFVTSHIHAQLGNQLFEIAAAVSYALDQGYEARFPELQKTLKNGEYAPVFQKINTSKFPRKTKFISYQEPSHSFQKIPDFPNKNVYLDGYFQSDKYFSRHKEYIIDLFSPSKEVIEEIQGKYRALLAQPTVAVHLRTFIPDGNDPEKKENWGGFNWEYFIKAIESFSEEHCFLVFSDRIDWVREHLPPLRRNCYFIEGNPAYLDFYLMSLCHHQIVSPRSSFSWWAAYLNKNPNKRVLVPEKWTTNSDGIPEGWVQIP